jgi:tRNA G18 (ribose-2'-O)-methylase SpoU
MKAGIMIGHLNNKGNEGSLLRIAEAFGINLVFVMGKKQEEYKSSTGADRHLIFIEIKNIFQLIEYAKINNHSIVCIENIEKAKEISEVKRYPKNPIFITGNERMGINEQLLNNADLIVKIKQANTYAKCLNTSIAGAIVIHDFYKKNEHK